MTTGPNAGASIATRLRAETKALHTQAERSGVMGRLLRGQSTLPEYASLLVALHVIYRALEEGLAAQTAHPVLRPLVGAEFARSAALASDLEALAERGIAIPAVVPDALRYAEHLRELSVTDPERLLAHAWLRYLGDLNGGQIVGRIVRESLALPLGATQFYEFPGLENPMAAAGAWRVALDEAPLDASTQDRIVEEAADGFKRHIALFEALTSAPDAEPDDAHQAA